MTRKVVQTSGIVAVAKAAQGSEGVHRLEDIEVQEVSLVDRPANKRQFLVVKRSDQMTTQVHADGKGGFTTAGGTSKAGPPPMAGAGAPPAGDAAGDGAKPPKGKKPKPVGKLDVPPGFKEMMAPMLAAAAEQLSALADAVDKSTPADIGDDGDMPPVPSEFGDALNGIMAKLDKLANMWPSAPAGADGDPDDPAATAGEGEPPIPSETQMRMALDNVGKVLGHPKVEKAAIAKIGAKMAKDRFARLQQAYSALGTLIGELGPAQTAAPAATGALGKAEVEAALTKALAPFVEGLNKVAGIVKQQRDEIATIQKSRGTGNAVTAVEGSGKAQDGFSWPLDLNNPVTKDSVSKTESFFGDD